MELYSRSKSENLKLFFNYSLADIFCNGTEGFIVQRRIFIEK